jgi:hypothetical protein
VVDFLARIHILTTGCINVTLVVPVANMLSKKQFIMAVPWRGESQSKLLLSCHALAICDVRPAAKGARAKWNAATTSGAHYLSILNHIMSMTVLPLTTGKREGMFCRAASISNHSNTIAYINTLLR